MQTLFWLTPDDFMNRHYKVKQFSHQEVKLYDQYSTWLHYKMFHSKSLTALIEYISTMTMII